MNPPGFPVQAEIWSARPNVGQVELSERAFAKLLLETPTDVLIPPDDNVRGGRSTILAVTAENHVDTCDSLIEHEVEEYDPSQESSTPAAKVDEEDPGVEDDMNPKRPTSPNVRNTPVKAEDPVDPAVEEDPVDPVDAAVEEDPVDPVDADDHLPRKEHKVWGERRSRRMQEMLSVADSVKESLWDKALSWVTKSVPRYKESLKRVRRVGRYLTTGSALGDVRIRFLAKRPGWVSFVGLLRANTLHPDEGDLNGHELLLIEMGRKPAGAMFANAIAKTLEERNWYRLAGGALAIIGALLLLYGHSVPRRFQPQPWMPKWIAGIASGLALATVVVAISSSTEHVIWILGLLLLGAVFVATQFFSSSRRVNAAGDDGTTRREETTNASHRRIASEDEDPIRQVAQPDHAEDPTPPEAAILRNRTK